MHTQSILIIDDSKLVNNSLRDALQQKGFRVTQAFNIEEAKTVLLEQSFNFALLDLVLPDGNGEDLLPFLQIHESTRVIVMTSDRDADRRKNLFNFGIVVDYVTKERHFNELEFSIVQMIERITTNKHLTLLIVDDSSFMRTHLRILLSKRGFNVIDAKDGKEALELVHERLIDAAIVDLEMPVMDGNKFLNTVKMDPAYLMMPIMIVSGTSDPNKIAQVIKNGADDFIKKPYSNEEFLLKVDKMIDVLKQKRLLKIHEARFATYNKAINSAAIFFKTDLDLNFSYGNDIFLDLLYKDKKTIEGLNLSNYILEDQQNSISELKSVLSKGESIQKTYSVKSDHYKDLRLRLSFTPIIDADKTRSEVLVIGFDVSLLESKESIIEERIEQKVQMNIEETKEMIQESKMTSMGELIGNIGHQWRQPLNSLALLFQKLRKAHHKQKLTNELLDRSTEKALRIINQMTTTIDDFRDFYQEDKTLSEAKLCDIVHLAHDILEASLQSHNIPVAITCKENISISCYKNELSNVILNIMSNAMDALLSTNTESPQIDINIDRQGDSAVILIEDNAGGISDEVLPRIFEPYFTTKTKDNGTGIGLYMSKNIIEERMKGKLEVFNTLIGASFQITLPIKSGEER